MPSRAQKFAVLGDSAGWSDARAAGLDPSGPALALARLPGPPAASAVDLAGPYAPDLEGFAVGLSEEVAFGAGANPSLVLVDPNCLDRRITFDIDTCPDDARLQSITGLAAGCNRLYLADEDAGRVLVFRLPGLELSASWELPFDAPRRIALDGAERVYVLDVGQRRVIRLHPSGRPAPAYDTGTIAALAAGLDLHVATDGTAFVTVSGENDIRRYSPSGMTLDSLRPPEEAPGLLPGAIAGDAQRLYVADRASGALWVYDLHAARWLAPLPRFRAPVVGLAVDGEGHLYVRTGADTRYLRLDARSVHISRGLLEAGPFDAGEGCAWMRVHVDAEVPEGTRVRVETALAGNPSAPLPWQTALSLDALVHAPEPMGIPPEPAARFLWIRVHLETDDPSRSPELREIVAETPGDDYLARLPVVYARRDADGDGFLRSLLEAFRAELGDRELEIAKLARRIDPETAPADHLDWLASWVAFELPPGASTAEKRKLLSASHALYGRRGTVEGLREMVRIYTGVDCEIVEGFRSRRLWALNGPARLGFDTGLLPALPDGMVVPGPSLPDASLQGLRAEYFLDDHLGTPAAEPDSGGDRCEPLRLQQPLIDPDGKLSSFNTKAPWKDKPFSVLWTGQIRARSSGLYTFYFIHKGGARLYVDNQLIIDSWKPRANGELRGSIPLSGERWYVIRIEYWTDNDDAPTLSWSCREHPKQTVPQECLYAVFDDNINPDARPRDGSPEAIVVGETVVGSHGPLAAEDFGAPLFDDTAHRFTVRVKAAAVKAPGKLEEIRAVLDAEKPAHTEYHLCVIEPTFLVGVQARIGIDAYVALDPPPGRYGEGHLGLDARLGNSPEHDDGTLRVAESLRIGPTAILR